MFTLQLPLHIESALKLLPGKNYKRIRKKTR